MWRVQKHRAITLERLELLETGKCYDKADGIHILGSLYRGYQPIQNIQVIKDTGRIKFQEMVAIHDDYIETKIGEQFGPTWSTHWFRVSFLIPQEWQGNEIHFIWDSDSEATLWSENGTILQGLNGSGGDDRRSEYIVTKDAQQFDEIIFYVEMACNTMFGAGNNGLILPPDNNRQFTLKKCEIGLFEREIWDLYCDYRILVDSARHLAADSLRGQQALYFGNLICNTFDKNDRLSWAKCREIANNYLKQTNGTAQHKVTAIGHCHIDTAWLWPFAETKRKCARSWATALEYMKHYEKYIFCASSAQQYDWVKDNYPELFSRIQSAATAGRFEVVGGTWVEFDGNIPSGESMVRQFLYGQQFFKKHFGEYCTEFFMPDTFGYSAQLPQIMKKSGIKYFLTQKLSWNLINKFPHTTFYWKGIDGTSVLTHFPPADTYGAKGRVDDICKSITNNKDLDRTQESILLFGFGDGGGGPTYETLEMLKRMNDLDGVPKIHTDQSIHAFFDNLETNSENLCEWFGELYLELHRGTYTTQSIIKKMNRKSELLLRDTEIFCCLLSILLKFDNSYPKDELESNWKRLLLSQFHDVLPGTSISLVYKDSLRDYEDIAASCKQILGANQQALLNFLSSPVEGKTDSLFVFNSLSWERMELVEVAEEIKNCPAVQKADNGKYLYLLKAKPFSLLPATVVDESSFEYCSVAEASDPQDGTKVYLFENQFLRASIQANGEICKLFVKECEREVIDAKLGNGNRFVMYDDVPFYWDAWDIMVYHLQTRKVIPHNNVRSRILEAGPLRVSLLVEWDISAVSSVQQKISLSLHDKFLSFDTKINWNENRKLLKVEFPCDVVSPVANYEIQFGYIQRPTHFNTSWDVAKFEVCAHRWADFSEYDFGLALLNDCKYSYSIHDHVLSLTLLKAPKAPDENCDMGNHEFTYLLYPHASSFQQSNVIQYSHQLNSPLTSFAVPSSGPDGAQLDYSALPDFFAVSKSNVILDAVKMSENDEKSIILRLYEAYGGRCSTDVYIPSIFTDSYSCSLLEEEQEKLIINPLDHKRNSIKLCFTAFEIKTVKLTVNV